jgi:hypothetical protein
MVPAAGTATAVVVDVAGPDDAGPGDAGPDGVCGVGGGGGTADVMPPFYKNSV